MALLHATQRRPFTKNNGVRRPAQWSTLAPDQERTVMVRHTQQGIMRICAALLAAASILGFSGCGEAQREAAKANAKEITLWTHSAGSEAELAADYQMINAYNKSPNRKATVKLQSFPQSSYNDSIISASSAGNLPCLVDVDQPNTPYWAWANILAPISDEALLKRANELMKSAKGTWNDKIYTVGYFDATTALFARKSVLEKNGIRIASVDHPWSKSEMDEALAKLKESGQWSYPFEIGTADNKSEWYAYAYGPILQSFGGDLINRANYQTSDGKLNGTAAKDFAHWMQNLVAKGYISSKGGSDTALDFVNNKSALLYGGIWSMSTFQQYAKDYGDIVAMPLTDFGHGSVAGGGSWTVGVTSTCTNKEAAQDYLRFSLQDKYIAAMSKAGMNIPVTSGAQQLVPQFAKGGDMQVFTQISQRYAKMRPETPAYNFISTEFRKTIGDIMNGADVDSGLDKAVNHIDGNIQGADGYTKN
ncbi:sugar ABC transporter substrate-binding protein [Bifidobacterium tibiigranuli]|nr:extracellular solute-binding protein [Bifidobacterium tibiigranuli]MCH4189989.1 extracellular solute-binding protein [Bifidobacterium tibiigranuli]MCH4202640.1 extracellular solute-binding protein [Bifidobacterium tibiigranuli]MCI1791263.1 extracellular solute-binding protein [Bifidobacterium tibiigranuli]